MQKNFVFPLYNMDEETMIKSEEKNIDTCVTISIERTNQTEAGGKCLVVTTKKNHIHIHILINKYIHTYTYTYRHTT